MRVKFAKNTDIAMQTELKSALHFGSFSDSEFFSSQVLPLLTALEKEFFST